MNPISEIQQLLEEDPRFSLEAYQFVREGLQYAHSVLHMADESADKEVSAELQSERHLTGQQLCQAIRKYALEQYGYMSKTVLNNWGIQTTGHFGDIVYNLIRIGLMKKSPEDRREDFDNVYEFDSAFCEDFKIVPPQGS